MAEFKMAVIIKLSENEWVWVRLNWFESESEWSESVFEWIWEKITRCLNPGWQNSRWLPSSSSVRMNEFESDWIRLSQSFIQNGWIQDGRIQDACHHLVYQIALVWVRVRVEGECFWVNLREDNKVSESKMVVWIQHGRIQDGCHHQVESEWMSEVFLCKCWKAILASVSEFERKY